MVKRLITLSLVFAVLLVVPAKAAYLRNVPQILTQPDGSKIYCFASGDEFYHWLHDKDDFTIVRDGSGYWVYAVEANGKLVASSHVLETGKPRDVSLKPGLRISKEEYLRRRAAFFEGTERGLAPRTGTINNLCIFIRFNGETEFSDPRSDYDDMLNSTGGGDSSMRNYYDEVSYGELAISTTLYPTCALTTNLSYQDGNARNFYQPYDPTANPNGYRDEVERKEREDTLLRDALNQIASQVPATLDIDGDNDGNVDNVCFIIRGVPDGIWNSLLWPHNWQLRTHNVQINGKGVWDYSFQLEAGLGVGVLCHEMSHTFGTPDLYHYPKNPPDPNPYEPVGRWDVMETDLDPPQHMGAYMKYRYGTWISALPLIINAGKYTLSPLTSSTYNALKFNSPQSGNEYYVFEYRRQAGTFENSVPGSGLLVYRINTACDGQGNADGPPDEVYIYRPGGTTTTNGQPNQAHFSADVGRTCINDSTDPSGFLSDGSAGGLFIADISPAGNSISFYIGVPRELTGSVFDGYGGPLSSLNNPYWAVANVTTPIGTMLTIGNGAVVYFNSGRKFTAQGSIICTSGSGWTNLFALNGYRTGIKCKGQIWMRDGGQIKLY